MINEITLNKPWKKVVWISTTTCNYSCSYCAPSLHNGKYRWINDYSNIIKVLNIFRKKSPLILDIMGGEPTLWPKFQDFCKDVYNHSNKTSIQFTSNGSRTVNYWKNFDAPVDTVGFSFHPEFAKEEHYQKILEILHQKYNTKVFLMMPPNYFKRIEKFYNRLKDSNLEIDIAIKLIKDNKHGGLIEGYTKEHTLFSLNRLWKSKIGIIDDVYPLLDGKKFRTQDLVNTGKDKFYGWHCNVGIDRMLIESNGDIYGSTCYISKPYGNINNVEDIQFPTSPTFCTKEFCGCAADIAITKKKNDLR